MNQENKWSLYFAIGLPILFLVGLLGVVYVPKLFSEDPQYNFIYKVRGQDYGGRGYGYTYKVSPGGKVSRDYVPPSEWQIKNMTPEQVESAEKNATELESLYLYDVKTGSNRRLTFEEALTHNLDSSSISPDGFKLEYPNRSGGLVREVFGGGSRDYNVMYLKKGAYSKRVDISGSPYSYYGSDIFLGWVRGKGS